MLVNEYRLEIQFKKVQKIRNINNIPTVGSRPLECTVSLHRTDFTWSLKVENFQLQNFFPTEKLCRPITFYKIFFLRKMFLSGNGPLHLICVDKLKG